MKFFFEVLDAKNGSLISSWGDAYVGIDPKGKTWGSHGIAIEICKVPCVQTSKKEYQYARVYIEDFTNHTVTAFDGEGNELFQLGTPGIPGNGTDPIQFGNVADARIIAADDSKSTAQVYLSDGDGGIYFKSNYL